MIAVVDYGRGNLYSLSQALRHLGAEHTVTSDAGIIAQATGVILPGVGAFGDAIQAISARKLVEPLKQAAQSKPFLGICVGYQMLFDHSEEFGCHQGLGLIRGSVERLPEGHGPDAIRVPNVGWRALHIRNRASIIGSMPPDTHVYFVHSFAPKAVREEDITAVIHMNGQEIPVAIQRGHIVGYQFHPERSARTGLTMIAKFVELT